MTLLPQETIIRKRDGLALTSGEISGFIAGLTDGSVSQAQAAAFAMAVYFRDMSTPERVALTEAMRDSAPCSIGPISMARSPTSTRPAG